MSVVSPRACFACDLGPLPYKARVPGLALIVALAEAKTDLGTNSVCNSSRGNRDFCLADKLMAGAIGDGGHSA